MFFLYIIHSKTSDIYYIGYSTDPWKRLSQHNSEDHPTFTSKHRPWTLKAVFLIGNEEGTAIEIERYVKAQHSKKLIQKLIDPLFVATGQLAQLVRVPHMGD